MMRTILQLISIILLSYLLFDSGRNIDIAAAKNNALTSMNKAAMDHIAHIDSVKQKAKEKIDIIRTIHQKHSEQSKTNFFILIALIAIQIFLLFRAVRIKE